MRLKWNRLEYQGKLIAFDSYMNLQLEDALEIATKGEPGEEIGEVFIRCNNVLFVRENVVTTEEKMVD